MPKYISVEGVIGVGKTTLTKAIAKNFVMKTMFEIVDENPFLKKFYKDPEHWGFQTETFFLCNRYMQLKKVTQILKNGNSIVSDYHILKNLIFAEINLKGEEFEKYKALYNTMIDGFRMPDIIVYAKANLKEIERRVNLRGRKMEEKITRSYLRALNRRYQEVMEIENLQECYPGTQLIEFNTQGVDIVEFPDRLYDLFEAIKKAMKNTELKFQSV